MAKKNKSQPRAYEPMWPQFHIPFSEMSYQYYGDDAPGRTINDSLSEALDRGMSPSEIARIIEETGDLGELQRRLDA